MLLVRLQRFPGATRPASGQCGIRKSNRRIRRLPVHDYFADRLLRPGPDTRSTGVVAGLQRVPVCN